MKILIPYFGIQDFNAANSKIVVGGVEKFIQDTYLNIPDVHLLHFPKEMSGKWRENLKQTVDQVNKIKPDLIINHYIGGGNGGTFGPQLTKHTDASIMNIVNISPGSIGSLSAVQNMKKMTDLGHTLWFVSKHVYNLWNTLSLRINKEELKISGIISPGFIKTKNEVIPIESCEYDIFTIGRCEASPKNPFLVHELGKKFGLRSLVISNPIDNEYYHKNKNWSGNQTTMWNLQHNEVLKQIPKCKFFVSTCNSETYGIAALESLSYGVPLLLNQFKDSHASASICDDINFYRLFNRSNFVDKYNELNDIYTNAMRSDIIESTYMKNNIENWILVMTDALKSSIRSKSNKLTLENFL